MAIRSNDWTGLVLGNGRYRVATKLGEGGMGCVYHALDRNLGADVVIKIPHPTMMEDAGFASRFRNEIQTLVNLSHPHIVKVTDVGEWEGVPFAVMQFLSGGSLEDRRPIGGDGRRPPSQPVEVARWLVDVAEALDYVHARGYVHRDVKPGNILFDSEGHAFVSDFGVLKTMAAAPRASRTAMTGTGMVLGTPEYMAPELIMGEPFDGRVDQYALAITVYEMLCGRRPFEDETKTKLLVLHTSIEAPSPRDWRSDLSEPLSRIVLQGLSKNPGDRHPSCVSLATAFAAAAGADPTLERVRFRCPECGKSAGMAAPDYAKLRELGGRPSCPRCKVALVVARADQPPAGAATASGEYEIMPTSRGETVVERPDRSGVAFDSQDSQSDRPGTMVLASRGIHGDGTGLHGPGPLDGRRLSSNTFVEKAPPRLGGTLLIGDSLRPASVSTASPFASAPGFAQALLQTPGRAVLAGAGASGLLATVAALVVWLAPTPRTRPIVPSAGNVTAKRASAGSPSPESPTSPASHRLAEATTVDSRLSTPTRNMNQGPNGGALFSAANPASPATPPSFNKPVVNDKAKLNGRGSNPIGSTDRLGVEDAKPEPTPLDQHPFDLALLDRPLKAKNSLEKTLTQSRSYAGRTVIPTGMYHVAPSSDYASSGRKSVLIVERSIQERKSRSLEMDSAAAVSVDVEPRLAAQLDRLTPIESDRMAILTLWFRDEGACLLVKVEYLIGWRARIASGTYYPKGDIEYTTLQVRPDGRQAGKAPDDDWEQPGRMLRFANQYKNRIKAVKNQIQNREMLAIQSTMGKMMGDMMRGAAVAEAEQRALQRAIGVR